MSRPNISLRRPFGDYSKVQALVTRLRRNRRFQLGSSRVVDKNYLNVGCGPNAHPSFINLEYQWHPGIDLCWDVTRGIPLPDGSMKGIFSEHCLEHFSLPTARFLLKEFRRVLCPGGTLRLVVPDAGLYLSLYARRMAGEVTERFPYEEPVGTGGLTSPLVNVNRIFYVDRDSPAGHCCMFDESLLAELLSEAGFQNVRRRLFRTGCDPVLLIDSEHRKAESLYIEAVTAREGAAADARPG